MNDISRLYDTPCFVVNMDACTDRWDISLQRIREAGFRDVRRFRGVDARSDDLNAVWATHGSPKFNPNDHEFITYPGKQGCMLSHLNLWKKIIEEDIPYTVVFEDDVLFHQYWKDVAPMYLEATPQDWDILYLGAQLDYLMQGHILRTPVFCTHAYVITLEGAKKLYDLLLSDPGGVWTIDCMLIEHMKSHVFRGVPCAFSWYAWNGTMFYDPAAHSDPKWTKRNTGLVFQDGDLGTFVRPYSK